MADKILKKPGDNKNMLFAALACILISILWFAYELTRELSPDEKKERAETARIQAEIDKSNAKRKP